jgi:hypothetical protein
VGDAVVGGRVRRERGRGRVRDRDRSRQVEDREEEGEKDDDPRGEACMNERIKRSWRPRSASKGEDAVLGT